MSRRVAAIALVMVVAVGTGACSTKPYKRDKAVRDLVEQSDLTVAQAECVVTAIENHFEVLIKAKQAANNGSPLPADRLKLEVDSALATIAEPTAGDRTAARAAVVKSAPNSLR